MKTPALAIVMVAFFTGCTTPGVVYHGTAEEVGRAAGLNERIAGFTDFEQVDGEWQCVYHINWNDPDTACVLQHEKTWHCEPGLEYASAYAHMATRARIRHAASLHNHPVYDDKGNRYRDCGREG